MFKVVLKSLFTSFAVLGISFVTSILHARLLGPEMRGEYGSIMLVASFIATLTQLGLGESYLFHRRKFYSTQGMLSFLFVALLIVFTSSFILIYGGGSLITFDGPHWVLCSFVVLMSVSAFLTNISRLQSSLNVCNMQQLLSISSIALLLIYCFYFDIGLTPLKTMYIALVSLILGLFIILPFIYSSEVRNKKINFNIEWLSTYSYGFKTYGTSIVGLLVSNFDKIFLMFIGGAFDFGVYIVAFNTSRIIGIIPQTLSNVIFSKFAGTDESNLADVTSRVFSLLFLPILSIALLMAIFGGYFIPLLFGEEYSKAIIPFSILVVECVISGLGWILAQRFSAAGRPGLVFIRQIFSLFPLLFLFVYMPPYDIGIVLAAVMLIASILRLLLTIYMYPKVFQEAPPSLIASAKDIKLLLHKFKRSSYATT